MLKTPSQHGIKLAVNLISSYFGDIVAKVCECLLRRGTLPLAQIIHFTELNKQNAVNSLLVLIQHNCVQAFATQTEGKFGGAPRISTQYMALFDNIIHHMRFPKFIAIVNEDLGKECEDIFVWLLQDGRLSVNDIVERHKEPSRNSTASEAFHECFRKLVNAQYVERCPAHEPFLAPPTEEEIAAKKRAAKFTKTVEDSIEVRALAEASPMDSIRFLLETETWTDDPDQKSIDDSSTLASAGEKRKSDALESGTKSWATNQKKEVLWRVNFEEFVRRLRHKSCIENVRARFDAGAATVLGAVLEATRRTETKVKVENSVPLSIDDIMQEVIKSEEGRTMNSDRVRASLAQLGCDMPSITGIDETYSIDLKRILELAQIQEVESIVLKRYGREACRIFKLLLKADRVVETEMISKDTFVDKKDAATILHQMWKDDYLYMQVMEKDKGKQKYLLWAVKKPVLWQHILDDMYHAALNLRLRSAYESEKDKEESDESFAGCNVDILGAKLLEIVCSIRFLFGNVCTSTTYIALLPREKREGEMGKRFERWRKIRVVLESSLMKLDDAILLFNDF